MSLGVPLKIMHEAVHHIVTVELKSGETFTGYMAECEVKNINIIKGHNEYQVR
jgi:small nuclear ribonucleoprotein D3